MARPEVTLCACCPCLSAPKHEQEGERLRSGEFVSRTGDCQSRIWFGLGGESVQGGGLVGGPSALFGPPFHG